ncbi:MAG: nitrous oxide reductase accessory protein NosL [Sterolibacteriaceae bacterium MAG5]|nr:nitrous oxide reductase accessory protein NosL [Candidatus Nitricoxidireducens bremensis]
MDRRDLLKLSLAAGAGLATGAAQAQAPACAADGTPAQFVPKRPADPKAAENDIEKFPKCPYCGMDRKQFHHSRMLVQYSDDLPDGTCSLHCAAISLAVNVDREPKAIYVGDNAAAGEPKPLVEVGKATFLVGSSLKGVMTKRSKVAFGTADAAKAAQAANGGELAGFDQALAAAYADMAADVSMIRKNREERRKRMMEQQHKG